MAFDNVFEGNPPPGVPSGPALGVDISTGTLYVSTPASGTWTKAGLAPVGVSGGIQYNNSGTLGGSAATITAAGTINVPSGQNLEINGSALTAIQTVINTIPGVLIANAAGHQLMFIVNPAAGGFDPNATWIWFGANIAAANLAAFNYDVTVDDSGNPVGQRNFKIQATDIVQLQSKTGAAGTPLECGSTLKNGGVHVQGNLEISAPNAGGKNPNGGPGFTDTIILGASHTPTSAATAGTAGELAWDGTNLYLCTVSGAATAATWKKLVLQAD